MALGCHFQLHFPPQVQISAFIRDKVLKDTKGMQPFSFLCLALL